MEVDTLKQLYRKMLLIRMVEQKICELYPQQEMRCPVHFCIGQEAIAAGVCTHLEREDYVLSTHRSHGHYLAKGGNLNAMMAEIYGKATGCCQGKGGSMHLVDLDAGFLAATPIVGSTIPIGVGTALASVLRGESRVTVVFFGDAAVEEGVFSESANFAVLKQLPVVFICENNFYSVNSPLSVRQPQGREIIQVAAGHGMESFQGDGNNVLEIYQLAQRAIAKARKGFGPTFLEFKTYRWLEHCGPNSDLDLECRSESDFQEWRRRCPIEMLTKLMTSNGSVSSEELEDIAAELASQIGDAVRFAKESPFPDEALLLKHVYAQ
jgi:TPP-dependent pyruvate/acetoin dehydrogenase alpha subunit